MRAVTIKPEFWNDETVVQVSAGASLLYLGLLCFSEGEPKGGIAYLHTDNIRVIRARILPGQSGMTDDDIKGFLAELENVGMAVNLSNDGFIRVIELECVEVRDALPGDTRHIISAGPGVMRRVADA